MIQNSAAYISGWLGLIKKDKKLVILAAGTAQKSADWILGARAEKPDPIRTPTALQLSPRRTRLWATACPQTPIRLCR